MQEEYLVSFVLGAMAACGAVTVTNPMEVVKTYKLTFTDNYSRLQLQGELLDKKVKRLSPSETLASIFKDEGFRGIDYLTLPLKVFKGV